MGLSLSRLLVLLVAALAASCRSGQSARELFAPDTLQVFGSIGDGDFEGEYGRWSRPIEGDLDEHAFGVSLGWNLTAEDREAQRETTRALRELALSVEAIAAAARRDLPPARCSAEPAPTSPKDEAKKCDEPRELAPAPPKTGADHATPPPGDGGSLFGAPGDLEGALYALAALATAAATYLGRHRLREARHRFRDRRARRAPPAGP